MNLLSLIPMALQFFGGQSSANAANQGLDVQRQGLGLVQQLIDDQRRRRAQYDPLETGTLLPGLQRRAQRGPFYAGDWLRQARGLRRPFQLALPRAA